MLRSLILALALVLASGFSANAQTGPTGSTTSAQPIPAANSQAMSPDRLVLWLRQKGYMAEVRKIPNGAHIVTAKVRKDNWMYEADIEFTADMRIMNLICLLGNAQNYSRNQLLDLLKRNYDLGGLRHFSIRGADLRLCLEDNAYATANMSDSNLENVFDNFLRIVRDTHSLWGNPTGTIYAGQK